MFCLSCIQYTPDGCSATVLGLHEALLDRNWAGVYSFHGKLRLDSGVKIEYRNSRWPFGLASVNYSILTQLKNLPALYICFDEIYLPRPPCSLDYRDEAGMVILQSQRVISARKCTYSHTDRTSKLTTDQ